MLTYKQKHAQANREALATVVALAVTVVVWVICGFGLSGTDIYLFHTPLWVIGGTLGTWACAIFASVLLVKKIFVDFEFDDEPAPDVPSGDVNSRSQEREGANHE